MQDSVTKTEPIGSMDKWKIIARFVAGEASDKEKNDIKQWAKDSPELQRFILLIQHFFNKSSINFNAYKEEDWNKIVERCAAPVRQGKLFFSYSTWIRIAASVLIFLSIGLATVYWIQKGSEVTPYAYYKADLTPQEVLLADGTHVFLNKNSTLKVPSTFGEKIREVVLDGEAFFNVTKNKILPFEVKTGSTITRVLGTSFNIRSEFLTDSSVVVSVAEGRVGVRQVADKAFLKQLSGGQAIAYTDHDGLGEITRADVNFLSWKTGVIRFENKDLIYVCDFLSKHYSIDLRLNDPALRTLTITTELDTLSYPEAIDVIVKTLNLRLVKNGNTFYIAQ